MKELTMKELLEMFDEAVHGDILDAAKRFNSTHVVVFENQAFDSSAFGSRSAVCVGPNNTYKTPQECEGKHLLDLPSQRQYPVAYAVVEGE